MKKIMGMVGILSVMAIYPDNGLLKDDGKLPEKFSFFNGTVELYERSSVINTLNQFRAEEDDFVDEATLVQMASKKMDEEQECTLLGADVIHEEIVQQEKLLIDKNNRKFEVTNALILVINKLILEALKKNN